YVKGELIGGCDIALQMYKSGELKKLLAEAGALGPVPALWSQPRAPDNLARLRRKLRLQRRLVGAGLLGGRPGGDTQPAQLARPLLGGLVAVAQAVAHQAEELGAALRVVAGVVGTARVPLEPRDGHRFGEHRLSERRTGEGGGVEARERMKRIALDLRARD